MFTIHRENDYCALRIPLAEPGYMVELAIHKDLAASLGKSIAKDKGLQELGGAELAASLVARYKLFFSAVYHTKNINMHNGPHGEPAQERFDREGRLTERLYFGDNGMQDGPKGEPCLQIFDAEGYVCAAHRYKDGKEASRLTREELNVLNAGLPPKEITLAYKESPLDNPLDLSDDTKKAVRKIIKGIDWL